MKLAPAAPLCLLFAFSLAALAPGCGARSQLQVGEPCEIDGDTVSCEGTCGEGSRTCTGGIWTECEVPEVVEECQNVCGAGTRTCSNEMWSECAVDRVFEACEGTCGIGEHSCEEGQWSECLVDRVIEECENECGSGTRICEDGVRTECSVAPVTRECTFGCGGGTQTCENNTWGVCDAVRPLPPEVTATVRDFKASHPDFEIDLSRSGLDSQIVADEIGSDGKPVYAGGPGGTLSTESKASFDQWYRSAAGVNRSTSIQLPLTPTPNETGEFYVYENTAFFPIDGQLFGNEGREHNFHFTLEAFAKFVYQPGQVFSFDGDDDMWVFINGRKVIDLGGIHDSLAQSVDLDSVAPSIGLVAGERYDLRMFFAERHTFGSHFTIRTSISDLGTCPEE